jgi:hypothetical protein
MKVMDIEALSPLKTIDEVLVHSIHCMQYTAQISMDGETYAMRKRGENYIASSMDQLRADFGRNPVKAYTLIHDNDWYATAAPSRVNVLFNPFSS